MSSLDADEVAAQLDELYRAAYRMAKAARDDRVVARVRAGGSVTVRALADIRAPKDSLMPTQKTLSLHSYGKLCLVLCRYAGVRAP